MSRIRNPFKRQDSFAATDSKVAPAELGRSSAREDQYELDSLGDRKDRGVENDEQHPEDPAALGVDELDQADRLSNGKERPIESAEDWANRLISTADDPDMPIHTFRMYFLGIGLTCFAAVLGQIFYFRPSGLTVSGLFILVIAHVLGQLWHMILPNASRGKFWAFLNPGPFNIKEHVAILIMCTTAFSSALAISVFAADDLYYNINPNYGNAIFSLISSQFLGYGIAGLMRTACVFPTYAFWPSVIPSAQLLDLLHRDKDVTSQRSRMKFFTIVAVAIFCWEFFPEFIAPTLTGVSIFCLAKRNGVWWSRVFGGAYPNEGMGIFSICLDWTYLSGSGSLYTPLSTQLTIYAGVGISAILICGAYATNIWNAQNFPFLAQDLFYENGTVYDQTTILNPDYSLNEDLLAEQGLPWYATSMAFYYLGTNLALGATITHCFLWYWADVKKAFQQFRTRSIDDAHYAVMAKNYKEVPMWVYGAIVLVSFAIAQATCYTSDSHLPWYGIVVAFLISIVLFPFISIFPAITGWQVDTSTLTLILGSAVVPGSAQANMYFTLYGSNSATQGISFASDLKLGQYIKLPPRTTLWVQSLGTVIGGILQIVIAKQIISTHREILLDVSGTNIWSGQQVQAFNAQAITWGALAKHMYSPSSTYAMIPLSIVVGLGVPVIPWVIHRYYPKLRANLVVTPLLCYTLGYLAAGINSGNFVAFLLALASQWYARKYCATWFRTRNFILSAALDAGSQFFVFVATFALFGAGNGNSAVMPNWALNPADINPDYCGTY